MANDLKFSIVIPTYNAAGTIASCLDSIAEQQYSNFEVWLIDAVSTDDTLNIVQQYQARYPYFNIVSEKDKGIYDAMNKGLKLCTGDWIYFLGSDDTFYDKNVLATVADKINRSNDKIIYGNVIMRGQNQWNLDNVVFNGEYDLQKMISTNICHQAIFYNKEIFSLYGNYDVTYITSADQEFNLRCYANTSFGYLDIIIANFFVGGQSTTVSDDKFSKNRGAMLMKYFGSRIFTAPFINMRLYLQQAALSAGSPLKLSGRVYCLLAYSTLKLMAMLKTKTSL